MLLHKSKAEALRDTRIQNRKTKSEHKIGTQSEHKIGTQIRTQIQNTKSEHKIRIQNRNTKSEHKIGTQKKGLRSLIDSCLCSCRESCAKGNQPTRN